MRPAAHALPRRLLRALPALAGLALLLGAPRGAHAEPPSAPLHVHVHVVDACSVSSSDAPTAVGDAAALALHCSASAAPRVEHGPVQAIASATYTGRVALTTVQF